MVTSPSDDPRDDAVADLDGPARKRRLEKARKNTLQPFSRTSSYYARSWSDYLDRENAREEPALPVARPTLRLASHAFRDELVLLGVLWRRPISDPAAFERIHTEIREALDFYGEKGWLDRPEDFFAPPPSPPTHTTIKTVRRRRTYERMSFDSSYEPSAGEPGRERWLSYAANRREHVFMMRHDEPRPWLVCVHGTDMGRAPLDLALFRAWHLHHDLGLNVVLPILPIHGPRARGLPKTAVYPGEDVLDVVHATAQAVWDIRGLLAWIRRQEPGAQIGLNGMSLGGYISALIASLEDDLTCAILGVPPANLVELLGHHSGLSRTDPRRQAVNLAEPIGRMISPLSMTPRVPMSGRFVYGGVADRIVHPREQVVALWQHWGRPQIVWYRGGHVAFLRSRPVHRFIDEALVQSGLVKRA